MFESHRTAEAGRGRNRGGRGGILGVALGLLLLSLGSAHGQEAFLRGDLNGDGSRSLQDLPGGLLQLVAEGEGSGRACNGAESSDAADLNDNEAVTIADLILFQGALFQGLGPVPEPANECGVDPDDSARGFDLESPAHGLKLLEVRAAGNTVEVDIAGRSREPVTGVQACVQYPSSEMTFEGVTWSGTSEGAFDFRVGRERDGKVYLQLGNLTGQGLAESQEGFQLATITFQWNDDRLPHEYNWSSAFQLLNDAPFGAITFRSTVVTGTEDHQPVREQSPEVHVTLPPLVRRFDVDGNDLLELTDATRILGRFRTLSGAFAGCGEGAFLENGDANDNEFVTPADALVIADVLMRGVAAPPGFGERCTPDETNDQGGFDAASPDDLVNLSTVRLEGTRVAVTLDLTVPGPWRAFSLIVRRPPGVSLGAEGFERSSEWVDLGLTQPWTPSSGDLTVITAFQASLEELPGGTSLRLGTLHFTLDDPSVPFGLEWVAEAHIGDALHRSTVVRGTQDFLPTFAADLAPVGTGFRRGDLDGDAAPTVSAADARLALNLLLDGGVLPIDCAGQNNADIADANDNEFVTVADYLLLSRISRGEGGLPAPSSQCGADPSDDPGVFAEASAPSNAPFAIAAGDVVVVSENVGPRGRDVLIPINVRAGEDVHGVQAILQYYIGSPAPGQSCAELAGALQPFSEVEGGAFRPAASAIGASRELGVEERSDGSCWKTLLVVAHGEETSPRLFEGAPRLFRSIGTLRFHLADFAVFPPVEWRDRAVVEGRSLVYRSSIVDAASQDHVPALLSGTHEFARGNANGDGAVDISDPQYTLGYLFLGGQAVLCEDAADANNDGVVDISDPIFTLGYLFLGTAPIPAPFPQCGHDVGTIDLLQCPGVGPGDACRDDAE